MKNLGAPDLLDYLLLALVLLQAYWNYKQYRQSQDARRII